MLDIEIVVTNAVDRKNVSAVGRGVVAFRFLHCAVYARCCLFLVTENVLSNNVIKMLYSKAICQIAIEEVPQIEIVEETPETIRAYISERGVGCLGSRVPQVCKD
jgi:hypothetical protein